MCRWSGPVLLVLVVLLCTMPAWCLEDGSRMYHTAIETREHIRALFEDDVPLRPESFAIVTNVHDRDYLVDFSYVLGAVECEWIELNGYGLPESINNRHLILIASPDSTYAWDIFMESGFPSEIDAINNDERFTVLSKEHPIDPSYHLIICTGPSLLHAKAAAEEVFYEVIGSSSHDLWLRSSIEPLPYGDVNTFLSSIMYTPSSEELGIEDLTADMGAKRPWSIERAKAVEDIDFLFDILEHGYSGYGYYLQDASFDNAQKAILSELSTKDEWSDNELCELIHSHLAFINDCHLHICDKDFCRDQDFYYADPIECYDLAGSYYVMYGGEQWQITSIEGHDVDDCIFPSLDASGTPVYRIGVLSVQEVSSLIMHMRNETGEKTIELGLTRSPKYSHHVFTEDIIGDIPVIRIGSFGDAHTDTLERFVASARRYRNEPFLIIDVRGNEGGNSRWGSSWISSFTGKSPSGSLTFAECVSKTSMMGRYNYHSYILDNVSGIDRDFYELQRDTCWSRAQQFESMALSPYWASNYIPSASLLRSDTTIIVITDGNIYSAGEGFVSYLLEMENVVVVGENTGGAVTFGQMSMHQLPNSKIDVHLPISLNVFVDLVDREGSGIHPDLWVPARDALNHAVAAVRHGVIRTPAELEASYFTGDFEREDYPVYIEDFFPKIAIIVCVSLLIIVNVLRFIRKRNVS